MPSITEVGPCAPYEVAMREARDTAITTIDVTHSTGYPDFHKQNFAPLTFHNGLHGRLVSHDGEMLASAIGQPRLYVVTTRTAGAAHDLVQVPGSATNEEESAEWFADHLRQTGVVPEAAIVAGSLAILGTKPIFENGILVRQKATELEYPSKEAELTAKCVAAGDLGHLYRPHGPLFSHLLYAEIQKSTPGQTPDMDQLLNFQRNQITMLETYEYPLAAAERHLATHKREVMKYSQEIFRQLEAGGIGSWEALIKSDVAFMKAHNDKESLLLMPSVIPRPRQPHSASERTA